MEKDNITEGDWWSLERVWKSPRLEQYRWLKRWIQECDPVAKWPVEDRLQRVQNKVMQAIAGESETQVRDQWPSGKLEVKSFKV